MPTTGRATFSVALCLVGLALGPRVANADVTGITGSGLPFSTQQPTLVMNYLISLDGIFPARDGNPENFSVTSRRLAATLLLAAGQWPMGS
jgi:hypothetical protein